MRGVFTGRFVPTGASVTLLEPCGLPEIWQSFTEGRRTSPNLWTDAYLCAFARAAHLTLVTFDSKIPARSDLNCLILAR